MLLERGAVVDARDDRGRTSLHVAVEKGKILFVLLLLEHGADVNARNKSVTVLRGLLCQSIASEAPSLFRFA